MKKISIIIMVGIILSLPAVPMAEEIPTVQLAGLRIVGSGYGFNGTELKAFRQRSGTSLAFVVHAPDNKRLVEVDDAKCSLMEFTDDQGQNLLDGVDWDGFPEISEDGRLALVEVTSRRRPSSGASKLYASGTLRLRVAASESTHKIDALNLEVGTKADVGQTTLQVMKVESSHEELSLVIQMKRAFVDNMKDIHFYTPQGKLLEIYSRGTFTFGSVSQIEYHFNAKTRPEFLVVEIILWQGLEILNLPFAIEIGVGF